MTKEAAVEKARLVAEGEGWPWQQPIFVQIRRRGIIFGSRFWEVRSNSASRGQNVEVTIDDQSGKVLGRNFNPR